MDKNDDQDARNAHLADVIREGRRDDAWERFLISEKPDALAEYLAARGEVDDNVRKILIDILRNGPTENNSGGKDRYRDLDTYRNVNYMINIQNLGKTKACQIYAERTNQEQRTVELQFDRGSKVYSPESDIFEPISSSNEK